MTQPSNWWATSGNQAPSAFLQYNTGPNGVGGSENTLTFSVVEDEEWDEGTEVTEHPVETGANVADHVRVALIKCTLKVFCTNEPIGSSMWIGTTPDQSVRGALDLVISVPTWTARPIGSLTYPIWVNPILERALLEEAGGVIGGAAGGGTGSVVGAAAGGILGALLLQAHKSSATVGVTAGLQNVSGGVNAVTVDVDQWPADTDYVSAMHALLTQLKDSAQTFTVVGSKRAPLSPMVIESLSPSRSAETGSGERWTIGFKQIRQVSTMVTAAPIPNLPAGGGKPTVSHGGQDPAPASPVVQQSGLSQVADALGVPTSPGA